MDFVDKTSTKVTILDMLEGIITNVIILATTVVNLIKVSHKKQCLIRTQGKVIRIHIL